MTLVAGGGVAAIRECKLYRVFSLLCLAIVAGVSTAAAQGYTRLVSQGSTGAVQADNVALSLSGRFVVFRSASPLDGPSTFTDIFIYDRWSGVIGRISSTVSPGGTTNGNSSNPTVTADGRYVAFESVATNLIAGDLNGSVSDVFVRDRVLNTTALVSRSTAGVQGNARSARPFISADGRYVIFDSDATNLVAGSGNAKTQLYLHDLQTGQTTLVSHTPSGAPGNDTSHQASIGYDGSLVAFTSFATDLVSGDNNGKSDVFLYNRASDTVTRISGVAPVTGASSDVSISADGSTIAFACLLPSAANPAVNQTDVYLYVRSTATYVLASVSSAGARGNASSDWPSLSADGRFVAFGSDAANLVTGDVNADRDVFVRDRVAGTTIRVNVGSNGYAPGGSFPNGPEVRDYISGDGRYVAFNSSGGLVPGANFTLAAYLRDTSAFTTGWITGRPAGNGDAFLSNNSGAISPDGRFVVFASTANNLVANDTNGVPDVFLGDRFAGTTTRVSVASDGTQGNGTSGFSTAVAADGTVVFSSLASNLVSGDTNNTYDVFVHDAASGQTARMDVRPDGSEAGAGAVGGQISRDGRLVAFESSAPDLVAGDTNGVVDIFVRDRVAATTVRASVRDNGGEANGASTNAQVATTGEVAFESDATNLVAGDTNGVADVFVRTPGVMTERVSVGPFGVQADGASGHPAMTPDGAFVAFVSEATNLDPNGDTNGFTDIYVYDRLRHQIMRASLASDGSEPNAACANPSISDDGRYVTFESMATNLVPTVDLNAARDVFVHDMVTGETFLASFDQRRTDGRIDLPGGAAAASISGDGHAIAFLAVSLATDDTTSAVDVYVRAFAPTLDDVSPGEDSVGGGALVTLSGSGFQTNPVVAFGGGLAVQVALSSPTTFVARTPAQPAGLTTVTVSSLDGGVSSLYGFRYVPCTFELPLANGLFGAAGGAGGVPVTANGPACAWVATSQVPWLTITSGSGGQGSGTVTFTVAANATPAVPRSGTLIIAGQAFIINQAAAPPTRRPLAHDLDGDGAADLTVWRGANGTFFWLSSGAGYDYARNGQVQWGNESAGDIPKLGDIDGDGVSDLVVWRGSTGMWFWLPSSTGYAYSTAGMKLWGNQSMGDVPFLGDVDGDGRADLMVWRASTGTWFWLTSSSGYSYAAAGQKQWGSGALGDVPLIGDIDGDGKSDLIVWRASTGTWYWLTSSSGYNYAAQGQRQWGSSSLGDVPLLGDLDGDGKDDLAVWRGSTGTWFWLTSTSGYNPASAGAKQWGSLAVGDIPLLGDLDRDGKAELVVWRASNGTFYWLSSTNGYDYAGARTKQWGNGTSVYRDRPLLR